MTKNRLKKLMVGTAVLTLSMMACIVTGRTGRIVEQQETIERDGVTSADLNLRMGAGKLDLRGGSSALLEGSFRYNNRSYAPVIDYVTRGSGVGDLTIEQEEVRRFNLGEDYLLEWHLQVAEDIPLDVYISLGAGKAVIDTRQLDLSGLEVDMGAGEATLILPESVTEDLDVSIQGGVGQLNVEIPEGTPVYADIAGGLGSVEVHGMIRDGNAYQTPAYGEGPAVYLFIEGGIGEINLEVR